MHEARSPALPGLEPGRRIGRYRLVRRIGAGGMGTVFEAEQDEPRRVVALKLLARAEDPEAIARFRYEAEVLAQLSHPGIAQIFEAGVERDPGGDPERELPWFAMEHVPGARTLLDYAEAERLPLARRLRLFLRVADAVQHGHEKGVVHRDLKPANLLVDAAGHPKVIDFGIARITSAEGPQRSLRTSTGQVLGTLRYMSPEQVSGERGAVDVRSDVFALGLVLFELVARRPAYELETLSLTEAVRAVAEARVPALRSVERALPTELEWIVQRACAPERERRYASVSELAADVERHLAGEAVAAAPPDTLYRLRRFVRRHHLAVGALGLVLASLAVSIAILARSLGIEHRALEREREERTRAQGNADFLSEMLSSVSPTTSSYDVRLVDVLDRAAPRIDARFVDQPLLGADLHFAIASSYRQLYRPTETLEHARAALELREQRLGATDPSTAVARESYAIALRDAGHAAEAEPIVRERIAALERDSASDPMRIERMRATLLDVLLDEERLDEAKEELDRWLAGATPDSLTLDELGILKTERALRLALARKDPDAMLDWLDRVAGEVDRLPPELAASCGTMLANRGIALFESGRTDEAEQALREALEQSERIFGPESQPAIATRVNLANVDLLRGDGEAALQEIERARASLERHFPPDHPLRLDVRYARCGALWVSGEKERAASELGPLIGDAKRVRPGEHAGTAEWEGSLGRMYVALGRPVEGMPWLESSVDTLSAQRGDADPSTQQSLRWLVRALDESGSSEQADELRARLTAESP